jgi:hypothetical protein
MEGNAAYAERTNPSNQMRELARLTLEEFAAVIEPFKATFQTNVRDWTMTRQPRTARGAGASRNGPSENYMCLSGQELPQEGDPQIWQRAPAIHPCAAAV